MHVISLVNLLTELAVSKQYIDQLKRAVVDDVMQQLKEFIHEGWPLHVRKVPSKLKPYFRFSHELTELDNIIFRNNQVEVPESLRLYQKTFTFESSSC